MSERHRVEGSSAQALGANRAGNALVTTNVTATATAELCKKSLGPGLRRMNFNYLPFPFNPLLTAQPAPHQIIYSEPHLRDGPPPAPPEPVPAVSAYTGAGDVPPPPGMAAPARLPEVLLPAEQPAPDAAPGSPPS